MAEKIKRDGVLSLSMQITAPSTKLLNQQKSGFGEF